jgi:hypothetical protein
METNYEALRQLRRVVANAPSDRFHMRAITEQASCGTAHCAIGWAIIDPWFQQNTKLNDLIPADHKEQCSARLDELADLFGISTQDNDNLFALEMSTTVSPHAVRKGTVIKNIDRLLADQPTKPYAAAR